MDERAHDLLSAAHRHLRDAEHLASPCQIWTSFDQSYHLAGFAPECARKATLSVSGYDHAIGHGVHEASEVALEVALAIDPQAARYDLEGWRGRYPALAQWSESSRYERTGRRLDAEAKALIGEAREIVEPITLALWMDGVVPAGFTW